MAEKTYRVVHAVEHDGKRFEPGQSIELAGKHAEPLLRVSVIADPDAADGEHEPRKPARSKDK